MGSDKIHLNVIAGVAVFSIKVIDTFILFFRKVKRPRGVPYQILNFMVSAALILSIGPLAFKAYGRGALDLTYLAELMLIFGTQ